MGPVVVTTDSLGSGSLYSIFYKTLKSPHWAVGGVCQPCQVSIRCQDRCLQCLQCLQSTVLSIYTSYTKWPQHWLVESRNLTTTECAEAKSDMTFKMINHHIPRIDTCMPLTIAVIHACPQPLQWYMHVPNQWYMHVPNPSLLEVVDSFPEMVISVTVCHKPILGVTPRDWHVTRDTLCINISYCSHPVCYQ